MYRERHVSINTTTLSNTPLPHRVIKRSEWSGCGWPDTVSRSGTKLWTARVPVHSNPFYIDQCLSCLMPDRLISISAVRWFTDSSLTTSRGSVGDQTFGSSLGGFNIVFALCLITVWSCRLHVNMRHAGYESFPHTGQSWNELNKGWFYAIFPPKILY